MMLFLVVSCKEEHQNDNRTYQDYSTFPVDLEGYLKDKKVYLTSIGQTLDMSDIDELALQTVPDFSYTVDNLLSPDSVENGAVVFIAVGCSIKALTESDITIAEELARARAFQALAKSKKAEIICFHIGGEKRRGTTSDQFIDILFPVSIFNIFLDKSDFDKKLTLICMDNEIHGFMITSILSLDKTIRLLLGDGENQFRIK